LRSSDEWWSLDELEDDDPSNMLRLFAKFLLLNGDSRLLPLWVPVLLFFSPRLVWWSLEDKLDSLLVPKMHNLLVTNEAQSPPGSARLDIFPRVLPLAQYAVGPFFFIFLFFFGF